MAGPVCGRWSTRWSITEYPARPDMDGALRRSGAVMRTWTAAQLRTARKEPSTGGGWSAGWTVCAS